MKTGRPRKPIQILEAQGTKQNCRHAKRAVEPKSNTAIAMPKELKGDAAVFWRETVPKFEAMKILDGVDVSMLVGLAKSWSNWRKEQTDYENGNGHIYRVAAAWNAFDKVASRFGMNPVDRTKLATSVDEESDPFTEWLKKKRGDLN